MKGALVFLIVFIVLFAVTLGNASIPPGQAIYGMLNVQETDYPVLGVPATTLVIAVFNGVVYGFILWLIFSLAMAVTGRRKKSQSIQQTVNVQIQEKEEKQKDVQAKEKEKEEQEGTQKS